VSGTGVLTCSTGSGSRVISGSGGLTKVGTGTLVLQNQETYSDVTTVSAGVLTLSSTATMVGELRNTSAVIVAPGATLKLDTSPAFDPFRLADTAPITLDGGSFTFIPSNTASIASAESFGDLILGAGGSIVSAGNGTASGDTTALTFGNLTRSPGA